MRTIAKPKLKNYNRFMSANTKYKDSVFSLLFSDPDVLRELYGTLEGVTLPPMSKPSNSLTRLKTLLL